MCHREQEQSHKKIGMSASNSTELPAAELFCDGAVQLVVRTFSRRNRNKIETWQASQRSCNERNLGGRHWLFHSKPRRIVFLLNQPAIELAGWRSKWQLTHNEVFMRASRQAGMGSCVHARELSTMPRLSCCEDFVLSSHLHPVYLPTCALLLNKSGACATWASASNSAGGE